MTSAAVDFYYAAKDSVFKAGYSSEYEWQQSIVDTSIGEREFLREYAWVVLNCGFREATVRQIFPFISLAFFDFSSASDIVENGKDCIDIAAMRFRNFRKLEAIVSTAAVVMAHESISVLMESLWKSPGTISLPFIGNITRNHLLKNIGMPVAKNDRHLARISGLFGFGDAQDLCEYISEWTGEPVTVVDIVLWRFATFPRSKELLADYVFCI